MRTLPRRLTSFLSAVAVAGSIVLAPSSAVAAETTVEPAIRLAGPERVATAVALSRYGWATSEVVVLARADDAADGLTGSAVAGRAGGPLLITPKDRLATEVATEIRRLGARRAIILGGPAAVSAAVEAQVRDLGVKVERLAGANRAATAARVAEWLAPPVGGTAFLVADWPDALAVSATSARQAAAGRAQPILLASGQLPTESRAALRAEAIARVVIVDGDRRIPPQVEQQLRADGLRVERIAGASRYEVSRTFLAGEISRDPAPRPLLLATGESFPDGLGAGALAARVGGRLMLTAASAGPTAERSLLNNHQASMSDFLIMGGDAALPEVHVRTILERPTTKGGEKTKATEPQPHPTTDPAASGRSGLHFSPAEVAVWRTRAQSGPYRVAGDISTNSPGDWLRIKANADALLAAPSDAVWSGPTQDRGSCVPQWADEPPTRGASNLRDAAFTYLVTGDARYAVAAKTQLMAQANVANLDFGNRDRWCYGVLWDINPSFQVTHWLTKLLYAYDYLGAEQFTASERARLDGWFADAARFWHHDMDRSFNSAFIDRPNGDYRIAAHLVNKPGCGRVAYLGGPEVCTLHSYYNNRKASIVRFVALVGVKQDDAVLKDLGARFVKEFLAYTVFPDGSLGEFSRWTSTHPDLGWAYATQVAAPAITIADAFARAGDPSLFRYSTSVGAFGTEGGTKNLRFVVRSLNRYLDGSVVRYGTDDATRKGQSAYRIDGVNGSWNSIHDVTLVQANTFYEDPAITAAYTRTGPGFQGYPTSPPSFGSDPLWMGEAGILPGALFMFGKTEQLVDPYGG